MRRLKKLFQRIKKRLFARRMARRMKVMILRTMKGIGQEARETKIMARTFFRMLENKLQLENRTQPPSKIEIQAAIDQLTDVGRFAIFSLISVLPGGGISLIALEILARKFGIRNFKLLPSVFRKSERIKTRKERYEQKLDNLIVNSRVLL